MFSSLIQVTLLAAAAVFPAAHAAPTEDCTSYHTGFLAAGPDPAYGFTVNSNGQLAYTGTGTVDALAVDYQACASLAPGNPDNTDVPGRFYVPSQNKCIKITNQADETGPYYAKLAKCDTTPPFRFDFRKTEVGGDFFWLGKTDEEGTDPQGGCGLLGYNADANGVPITKGANHRVEIVCDGKPFQVVRP